MTPGEAVGRWLRLVVADAELSPYLIGVDLGRLGAHLTAGLANALDGRPAAVDGWQGLGLSEAQHRRVVDYLMGVLWAAELPDDQVARVRRAFEVPA
ncbi:hypothetical protein ACWD6L_11220 [Micromonospora profundi]|uniref:Globin n=1 Tax=Micromonospora profundi TaxID=1420889 RepID=A0AAJ6HTH3_9ACTN|nr:hypothetical protein [Micromonospora profundi]NJC14471.1 mono/diheme cytochrome c family protein [Micromonospora profundi]WLS46027.1 hypothetical protein Q3V37_01695 [Micromonospora profundi]